MLRALKHAFTSPRLLAFKATSAGGACTVNIGQDDVYSAASSSTGRSYLTLGDVFSRPGIVCGSPGSPSIGASGALLIEADPTISLLSLLTHDGTNPDDGVCFALALGYDSLLTDYHTLRNSSEDYIGENAKNVPHTVKSSWNAPRLEIFKITPHATTPVINRGGGKATLTRNNAGDYTITFKRPFASDNVVAAACVISASAAGHHIVSTSALSVRVLVNVAGTGSDANPFYVVVKGSDNPQYGARHRRTARISERLPRLIAGHIAYSGGTPSIVCGTGDFTLIDTGTGQVTVIPTQSFAGEPILLGNQDAAGLVTAEPGAAKDGWTYDMFNGAGAATDPADLHFMAFGYDDAVEYAV